MNSLERVLMFAVVTVLLMIGLGCDQFHSADDLRNAKVSDPATYFQDDRLRASTLDACASGSAAEQQQYAALEACKIARRADSAKRAGWKP
jgi:hypothetical protein